MTGQKPRKIFFAIPSQCDAVKINTMQCVLAGLVDCLFQGWTYELHGYAGINPISNCRNFAFAQFLASDCDDLVFIDDDLAWERGALTKLLSHPVDFVCGVYPYRAEPLGFPVRWLDGVPELIGRDPLTMEPKHNGLLEVAGTGFGFARITRACAERMVRAYGNLEYVERGAPNETAWMLFQLNVLVPGTGYFSEDMIFGKRWRDIGGKVWVDPMLMFVHIGNKGFPGCLGDWLREQPAALRAA